MLCLLRCRLFGFKTKNTFLHYAKIMLSQFVAGNVYVAYVYFVYNADWYCILIQIHPNKILINAMLSVWCSSVIINNWTGWHVFYLIFFLCSWSASRFLWFVYSVIQFELLYQNRKSNGWIGRFGVGGIYITRIISYANFRWLFDTREWNKHNIQS